MIYKHGRYKEEQKSYTSFCTYEELWRVPQMVWFLIIEFYHVISKKMNKFCTFPNNKH